MRNSLLDVAKIENAGSVTEIIAHLKSQITYTDIFISSEKNSYSEAIQIIKHLLEKDQINGKVKRTDFNTMILFSCDPYLYKCARYDICSGNIYTSKSWRPFEKTTKTNEAIDTIKEAADDIWRYIVSNYGGDWSFMVIERKVEYISKQNKFDAMNMYLDFLEEKYYTKEMKNPLNELIKFIKLNYETEDKKLIRTYDSYVYSVFDLFYFKLMTLNSIIYHNRDASISYPMDVVPILIGGQGVGKSTFIDKLAGSDQRFFERQSSLNIAMDKDELRKLTSKLIVELGEIRGSYKEQEKVKDFITKSVFEVRPAYGRSIIKIKKRWGGVGTSNKLEGLINDETGGRRWFPILVDKIEVYGVSKTNLPARVLAYYWHNAKELVKNSTEENYIQKIYDCHNEMMPEEFKKSMEEAQESAQFIPEYYDETEKFINNNRDFLFKKQDIYQQIFPPDSEGRPYSYTYRQFMNYVGKILKKNNWVNVRKYDRVEKMIRCWVYEPNKEKNLPWFVDTKGKHESGIRSWE